MPQAVGGGFVRVNAVVQAEPRLGETLGKVQVCRSVVDRISVEDRKNLDIAGFERIGGIRNGRWGSSEHLVRRLDYPHRGVETSIDPMNERVRLRRQSTAGDDEPSTGAALEILRSPPP